MTRSPKAKFTDFNGIEGLIRFTITKASSERINSKRQNTSSSGMSFP